MSSRLSPDHRKNKTPDDMVKAVTVLSNTSPDLKNLFADDKVIHEIASGLFKNIFPERDGKIHIKRTGSNIYVVADETKNFSPNRLKMIFSLDTNGQILVEQSIQPLLSHDDSNDKFFQYHLSHKNVNGNNHLDVQPQTVPLPEILNDDHVVKKAFKDTYRGVDFQNLSIER